MAVSAAIVFTGLQAKVNALEDNGASLKRDYEQTIIRLDTKVDLLLNDTQNIKIGQTELKKDIEFIKQGMEK